MQWQSVIVPEDIARWCKDVLTGLDVVCALTCRVLTFTYVALLFGLMGYGISFEGVEGFRSRNNILFVTNLNTMLFPYISISLFTSDKRIYLADASAKRYRPGAYYVAKVRA